MKLQAEGAGCHQETENNTVTARSQLLLENSQSLMLHSPVEKQEWPDSRFIPATCCEQLEKSSRGLHCGATPGEHRTHSEGDRVSTCMRSLMHVSLATLELL